MVLTVLTYAPPGGSIAGERVDGRPVDAIVKNHDGRQVAQREVFVDPGGSHVIRWYVVGGRGQTRAPLLQVTPGANSDGVGSVGRSVC
jgi:hypothetical protein